MNIPKFINIISLCYMLLLYSHLQHHNDTIIKQTQEDFFRIIFTSHFIARVWKGCLRVCMWEDAGDWLKLHILTPLLWPSRCVFIVLLMLGSTPSGLSEGPLGLVWPSLPHLVSNPLGVCWQLLWDPNSTELNNNSTPTRSPTGSLKLNV